MMLVAADLLKERPVRRHAEEAIDEFGEWLSRYLLTRPDGKWLADRRDPRLVVGPPAPDGYGDKLWRWSVTTDYLDQQLTTDDGLISLWGYWTGGKEDHTETVSVRSALVARTGAEALVATLQTAPDLGRFILPMADVSEDLEAGHLKLRGWVRDENISARLDERDPWAEGLRYPGPAPCDDTVAKIGLAASADGRTWKISREGMVRSETWTFLQGYGREAESISGSRLSGDEGFLKRLLDAYPEDRLILSVEVSRRPTRYGSDKDEFERYPGPYVRYYLMGDDCVAHAL